MMDNFLDLSVFQYCVTTLEQKVCTGYSGYPCGDDGELTEEGKPSARNNITEVDPPVENDTPSSTRTSSTVLSRRAATARERYHKMTAEERYVFNRKKTLQKDGRKIQARLQMNKELNELNELLRATGHLDCAPDIHTAHLPEKDMDKLAAKRARWAASARKRYANKSPEERKSLESARRMKEWERAERAAKDFVGEDDAVAVREVAEEIIRKKNALKAEQSRLRYHNMTDEEKKQYNARQRNYRRKREMRMMHERGAGYRRSTNNSPTVPITGGEMVSVGDSKPTSKRKRAKADMFEATEMDCQQINTDINSTSVVPSEEMMYGDASISAYSMLPDGNLQMKLDPYPPTNQEMLDSFDCDRRCCSEDGRFGPNVLMDHDRIYEEL